MRQSGSAADSGGSDKADATPNPKGAAVDLDPGQPVRRQLDERNASTGCSSIPFGAWPRWLWIRSKKPTPVMVAVPASGTKVWGGRPQAASKLARALTI